MLVAGRSVARKTESRVSPHTTFLMDLGRLLGDPIVGVLSLSSNDQGRYTSKPGALENCCSRPSLPPPGGKAQADLTLAVFCRTLLALMNLESEDPLP